MNPEALILVPAAQPEVGDVPFAVRLVQQPEQLNVTWMLIRVSKLSDARSVVTKEIRYEE